MTYTKAILEIELFDVEDVITTSNGASKPVAPPQPPEVAPALPLPPQPEPGDGPDESSN